MTLNEIKAATASLVFAQELADLDSVCESGFYPALARAIWVTDALRPKTRIFSLTHTPPFEMAEEVGRADVLYDLRILDTAVINLTEPPALLSGDEYRALGNGYILSGGTHLYLTKRLTGEYRLTCRMRPMTPDESDDPDLPLPLDEDLAQLLPLLTAHYLLLDDDAEKANHYLSLYREQYALLATAAEIPASVGWHSVNSW